MIRDNRPDTRTPILDCVNNLAPREPRPIHRLLTAISRNVCRIGRPLLIALCGLVLGAMLSPTAVLAQAPWQETLTRMPLREPVRELNRTNCVQVMLDAFQSNDVVKAMVFMPGATDEFYLFRRARAVLTNTAPTLLDAMCALAAQTNIRADFQVPFLILHTNEDPLDGENRFEDAHTADRLKNRVRLAHLNCNDKDWDFLQPVLKRSLKVNLRPWRYSTGSWHFYRHSFAAWNINGLQALELAGMAGKSKFVLLRGEARFEVDTRVRSTPSFDLHLH